MRTLTRYEIDAALATPAEFSMWLQEHVPGALVGVLATGPKSPLTYWLRSYGAIEACVWSDVIVIDGERRLTPWWALEFIRAMDSHGHGPITAAQARLLLPRSTTPEPLAAPTWQVMARGRPSMTTPRVRSAGSRRSRWSPEDAAWLAAGVGLLLFAAYLAWHVARWGVRGWA